MNNNSQESNEDAIITLDMDLACQKKKFGFTSPQQVNAQGLNLLLSILELEIPNNHSPSYYEKLILQSDLKLRNKNDHDAYFILLQHKIDISPQIFDYVVRRSDLTALYGDKSSPLIAVMAYGRPEKIWSSTLDYILEHSELHHYSKQDLSASYYCVTGRSQNNLILTPAQYEQLLSNKVWNEKEQSVLNLPHVKEMLTQCEIEIEKYQLDKKLVPSIPVATRKPIVKI